MKHANSRPKVPSLAPCGDTDLGQWKRVALNDYKLIYWWLLPHLAALVMGFLEVRWPRRGP